MAHDGLDKGCAHLGGRQVEVEAVVSAFQGGEMAKGCGVGFGLAICCA